MQYVYERSGDKTSQVVPFHVTVESG
jgi:hypothetical protein